jgi:hypothetical protein
MMKQAREIEQESDNPPSLIPSLSASLLAEMLQSKFGWFSSYSILSQED